MSRLPPPFLFFVLLFLGTCQAHERPVGTVSYVSDHVLLAPRESLSKVEVAARLKPLGYDVRRVLGGGVYVVALPKGKRVPQALDELGRLPWVRYVEPDYIRRPYGPAR